jgi:hypothetical protein
VLPKSENISYLILALKIMIWKNLRDTDHVLAMRKGKEDVVLHMVAELTNFLP